MISRRRLEAAEMGGSPFKPNSPSWEPSGQSYDSDSGIPIESDYFGDEGFSSPDDVDCLAKDWAEIEIVAGRVAEARSLTASRSGRHRDGSL